MPRDESLTATPTGDSTATLSSAVPESERHATHSANDDELLTVHDAARFLKVSASWVYEHARPDAEHRLPVVKLGKYLRFDRRDLQAYIDAKRAESRRQSRRR